ncbi:Integrase [[Ruminococcus] torques]|nr:integrase DNA-binding domain-containing protein [[Ruminococcus] torques]CUQ69677.1 Integrase [[Ruminococcus] torques]
MANTKRKDKSRKVLRKGESQRPDGTYQFRWTDENRKRHCIYARNLDDLRYKEDEIDKDKKDGIKAEARYTSLNDMYELWRDLKRGIKNNTFENYKYMYETFVRNQIGSQFIMSIKKTDIKRYYNSLVDERHLKPATIDSIHTVLHQVFEMAVDDDYIRSNPTDNVLRELKKSHCFKTEKRRALTKPEQELFLNYLKNTPEAQYWYPIFAVMVGTGLRVGDDDDKIRLNQRKPSKYKGLSRFGPEKNLQRINKFMKERPIFYKNLIQMKENFRFYLRCFYCITKVVILQFNSENRTELARNG